jgi:two-component system cell cycle sensor histidine kinase/response regulator CckA
MGLEADMQGLGFDICDLAADGQAAFLKALAMEDPPDIVLMDVNLEGGREGIEAARWLREVCDVPIVFVTGNTDLENGRPNPSASAGLAGPAQVGLS